MSRDLETTTRTRVTDDAQRRYDQIADDFERELLARAKARAARHYRLTITTEDLDAALRTYHRAQRPTAGAYATIVLGALLGACFGAIIAELFVATGPTPSHLLIAGGGAIVCAVALLLALVIG